MTPLRSALLFVFLISCLGLAADLSARPQQVPDGPAFAAVPAPIRSALTAGDYDRVLSLLAEEREQQPDRADLWVYLEGLTQSLQGELEAAATTLERLEAERDSAWWSKARFQRAEIYRRLRRFDEAEAIYEEAAKILRGNERQAELAEIYLDFADDLIQIKNTGTSIESPDYGRAQVLYAKVLELGAPATSRERARFGVGHCLQKRQDWNGARQAFEAYLNEFDPVRTAASLERGEVGERVFEVRQHLGEALAAQQSILDARRVFEDLAAALDEAQSFEGPLGEFVRQATPGKRESWHRLRGEALFAAARTYPGNSAEFNPLAVAALQRFLEAYPNHTRSSEAAFEIAERYRAIGHDEDAVAAYQAFLDRSPPTLDDDEVREQDALLRRRALFLKGAVLARQQKHEQAIAVFEEYTRRHPTGSDWSSAQTEIINAEYAIGVNHRAEGSYLAARDAWHAFLEKYPLDGRAAAINYDLGDLFLLEARDLQNRERKTDETEEQRRQQLEQLYRAAIAQWRRLSTKYPGTHQASSALYQIAYTYEMRLKQLDEAIEAYRDCNFGPFADDARVRLEIMMQPALAIRTERTWRSDESAKIALQLRNIEQVQVEVYALDLESYFRKHLTHRQIEGLDLDLIAPDFQSEVEIEEYAPYRPVEMNWDLPVEGAGVWAVAVQAGDQRATTLVLRSDIDLIVKSSRKEVLVYAQDMRQSAPAEGVQVLVGLPGTGDQDGRPTVLEATTGADGVVRLESEELQSTEEVRVFGFRSGHCASEGTSLSGLQLASGLGPRGYVYTDRSAYRPGQQVSWRGVIRSVENGSYTFEPGQSHRVEIVDPQGRVLKKQDLSLSEFGTLHGDFQLDGAAAIGTYGVRVQARGGPVFAGQFQVHEYQLQKVEVDFDLERTVYYRGETVEIVARANYYYGDPVVDSPIRIELPDGRVVELRTDEKGEARTELETRDFPAEGMLGFAATLTEENVRGTSQVYLAIRGYQADLQIAREIYLAGQTIPLRLKTHDPAGEPIARQMQLQVLRRESSPLGGWSEVLVEEQQLETQEEDGLLWSSVHLVDGGQYILRVRGEDRFGNPILAQDTVFVSGAEDQVKLRLLAEEVRLDVGEKGTVDLHNRAESGLALLTFEGEGILEYRVIEIEPGSNALDFEVDHSHFPNFVVSVATMQGNRFFEAETEFSVTRRLQVSLKPDKAVYEPGEEAEVEIEVRDQLGRPVQAELSLAVVDAALLEQFPESVQAIQHFFENGAHRQAGMRVSSTCTFSYEGVTTSIAQAILAEAERAEADQAWDMVRERARAFLNDASPQPPQRGAVALRAQVMQPQEIAAFQQEGTVALIEPDAKLSFDTQSFGYRVSGDEDLIAYAGVPAAGQVGTRFAYADKQPHLGRTWLRHADAYNKKLSAGEHEPRTKFAETAYWSPSIVSDAEGKATLKFRVPAQSTRWRMLCRGVGPETLVGQMETRVHSKSEFFVELRVPNGLTEGDRPRFVARVHNLTGKPGRAELKLIVNGGAQKQVFPVEIEFGSVATVEHVFPATAALPARAALSLQLEANGNFEGRELSDALQQQYQVQPWGIEHRDAVSGVVSDSEVFWLNLPEGGDYRDLNLDLSLGLGLDRLLIAEAMGQAFPTGSRSDLSSAGTRGDAASQLIGTLAVLDYLQRVQQSTIPEATSLRNEAVRAINHLAATQRDDGGWSWIGEHSASHPQSAALVMWSLGLAQRHGLDVPPDILDRGRRFLHQAFQAADQQANELKAMLLHALAVHGQGDFGAANRLHRVRNSLSPAALAYTVLALVEMKRVPMTAELAQLLEDRAEFDTKKERCLWPTTGNLAWNGSQLETTALVLRALELAKPSSPQLAAGIAHLMSHRPWRPMRAHGLALAAVAAHTSEVVPQQERVQLVAKIGNRISEIIRLSPDEPRSEISLRLGDEPSGRVRVELGLMGRGRPHFTAQLRGFSRKVEAKRAENFTITRHLYLAPNPVHRGKEIKPGFNVLKRATRQWNNLLENLPLGQLTHGQLDFYRDYDRSKPAHEAEYLTLEIPLPAGTRLLEGSLRGNFVHHETRDGRLILHTGQHRGSGRIYYTLVGVNPGQYRALPAILRSAYVLDEFSIAEPQRMQVLDRGARSRDDYRATPDELYHLGRAYFENDALDAAHDHLSNLYEEFGGDLKDGPLKETARMLLFLALHRDDAHQVVRYFEVLKEKHPELTIDFDKVVAVGEAYRTLEEYERALLIFRATIEETFGKDLKVVGTLEQQGEFSGALDTLARFWAEYPDLPTVVEAHLALSDKFLSKAPQAHKDESLREAGRSRADLSLSGIRLLRLFMSLYPENPLAADAGLNLVSAHLELEDYERSSGLASEFADRFTEPKFSDAFTYTRAVAEWYLGHEDEAMALLTGIAEAEYPDDSGNRKPSENRDLALYILGQIHHARQDMERAAEFYDRVDELFSDAREALNGFREKRIELDEVTSVRPDEDVALRIRYRNVQAAELLVYPVDLMTLYLREKNLSKITQVNLAGIAPKIRRTIALGDGRDLREQEHEVQLSLEEPGAYLVICRGDELHTSGLVLVTDLDLNVKEDPVSGRIRIQVANQENGRYLRDVDVRVIGSSNAQFVTGRTDPRGLFIADSIQGTSTVIARLDRKHYAFYRGALALGVAQVEEQRQRGRQTQEATKMLERMDYFDNVQRLNDQFKNSRGLKLQQEIDRSRKGVQVRQAQ